MNRRVPLWLARVAVAMCATAPFFAAAQETPPAIVIVDDISPPPTIAPADAAAAPVVAAEQSVPDHWIGLHLDALSEVTKAQLDISHGMAVIEVIDKGPAQKAGIQKHDILATANGVAVNGQDDIFRILSQSKGEPITIQLVRKGNRFAIRLTPEKRPESAKPAPGGRIVIGVPPGIPPIAVPVIPQPVTPPPAVPNPIVPNPVVPDPAAPAPTAPRFPQLVLPPADPSQCQQLLKELEQIFAQEREAAANHLRDARKAYEEAYRSFDSNEVESMIKSAIDELSKSLKDHVSEAIKALNSDEVKAMHRELLNAMGNLERTLRDQREVPKLERLELREKPANTLESLRQEIKSLRNEIDRLKRETK